MNRQSSWDQGLWTSSGMCEGNVSLASTTYTSPTLLWSFDPVFCNAWTLFEKLQVLPADVRGIGLTLKDLGCVGVEKTPQRARKPKRSRDASSPLTIQELLKRPHKAAKPMLDWNTVFEMCELKMAVMSEEAKEANRLCEWMMSERSEEEEWVRGYMESHDPNEELVVVMKELLKARLKCDVHGSEKVVAVMKRAKNEEWERVLLELEEMVKSCFLWL